MEFLITPGPPSPPGASKLRITDWPGRGSRASELPRNAIAAARSSAGGYVRRVAACPRPDWQNKVEAAGLSWHTLQQPHDQPYWNESAFYEFTAKEIGVV